MMKTARVSSIVAVVAILLLATSFSHAQTLEWVMEFNDGPESLTQIEWSEYAYDYWEEMFGNAATEEQCSICDLMPEQDFFAYSPLMTTTFEDCDFCAEIYFANNWPGSQNVVYVRLGTGLPGNAASFVPFGPQAAAIITNQMAPPYCGQVYFFDFGTIPLVTLSNESLIVRIDYGEDEIGDGHIYWNSPCCPSALHIEFPPSPVLEGTWSTIKALYR